MMRLLMIVALFAAVPARADEAEDKRAASRPGASLPFGPELGRRLDATLSVDQLPKAWRSTLAVWRAAGRTVVLPAELPKDGLLLSGSNWYSLKWREGDRHVVMMVHAAGARLPGLELPELEPEQLVIGRSHALLSADARVEGLAVRIDVECRRGLRDPHCGEDEPVSERFEGLAVLR